MERPPRIQREPILDRSGILAILGFGGYIGVATLLFFQLLLGDGGATAIAHAQTFAFTGIVVMEMVNVFNFRTLHAPLPTVGWLSNPWVPIAVCGMLGLQIAAVYHPFMQRALHTAPLDGLDWIVILAVAIPLLLVGEAIKWRSWRRIRFQP
jgi:Ca2+-transporting ATPase